MKKNFSDDNKLFEEYSKIRYYCRRCGHSVIIHNNKDKVICDFCGYYIFKTPKDEFKFRMGICLKNGG